MKTFSSSLLFALAPAVVIAGQTRPTAAPIQGPVQASITAPIRRGSALSPDHAKARELMAEAQRTTNPIRLFFLALQIKSSLDAALERSPDDVEIRLDLVRFYTVAPRIAGGGIDDARAEAARIAERDPPMGHFARGYIAYREKEYGAARLDLREAVRTAHNAQGKALSLRWLGWLSQESQRYDEAFAAFDELGKSDPSGLYEIGRTAAFCSCQLERGKTALEQYLHAKPTPDMPSLAAAHFQLALVNERLGNLPTARREITIAYRLDRSLTGVKEARRRIEGNTERGTRNTER